MFVDQLQIWPSFYLYKRTSYVFVTGLYLSTSTYHQFFVYSQGNNWSLCRKQVMTEVQGASRPRLGITSPVTANFITNATIVLGYFKPFFITPYRNCLRCNNVGFRKQVIAFKLRSTFQFPADLWNSYFLCLIVWIYSFTLHFMLQNHGITTTP